MEYPLDVAEEMRLEGRVVYQICVRDDKVSQANAKGVDEEVFGGGD